MADYLIPLKSDSPHFDLSIDLSGREYRLEFLWSVRESSWYIRIYTDTDDHLHSAKLVVNVPIGHRSVDPRSVDPRMPAGTLMATDTTGRDLEPTWDESTQRGDLGRRVVLQYFEAV